MERRARSSNDGRLRYAAALIGRAPWRSSAAALSTCALVAAMGLYLFGSALVAPRPARVGPLPGDLRGESVAFPSASGSRIKGWFLPGRSGNGAVLLLHGVRSNRTSMLARARWLQREGYAVLLVDLRAHGESMGDAITFGYLESRDAQAAVALLRDRLPGERIGVIGCSMGGAAAVLADPPLEVDALVLEAVFPTIEEAVEDRLAMRLGSWSRPLAPALTLQLQPRLGVEAADLRPISRVGALTMPKLFIAGTEDRHTGIDESRALAAAAAEPKELWEVEGASHVDLHRFDPERYEARVGAFLAQTVALRHTRVGDWPQYRER